MTFKQYLKRLHIQCMPLFIMQFPSMYFTVALCSLLQFWNIVIQRWLQLPDNQQSKYTWDYLFLKTLIRYSAMLIKGPEGTPNLSMSQSRWLWLLREDLGFWLCKSNFERMLWFCTWSFYQYSINETHDLVNELLLYLEGLWQINHPMPNVCQVCYLIARLFDE